MFGLPVSRNRSTSAVRAAVSAALWALASLHLITAAASLQYIKNSSSLGGRGCGILPPSPQWRALIIIIFIVNYRDVLGALATALWRFFPSSLAL